MDIIEMEQLKLTSFCFTFFFTTRTNFKPKQTQTNSFILVSSEAVTTRDNLHFVFCRFASREAAMPTGTIEETNVKQQALLGVCVEWKRDS